MKDESKRHAIEQCNQYAEAVARIDEVSEQFDHFSAMASEQQNDLKILTNKCMEMAQNIEQCKLNECKMWPRIRLLIYCIR